MNTPETQSQIDRLDLAYAKLTGRKFRASGVITGREQFWLAFIKAGYGIPELETTILWIKKKILAGYRQETSLMFRVLIADLARFEDDLCTAQAENRNARPHHDPKASIVANLPTVRQGAPVELITAKRADEVAAGWIAKMREAVG